MRILGLTWLLASCTVAPGTESASETPDAEESGSSDRGPSIQHATPVSSGTEPAEDPRRTVGLSDPDLGRVLGTEIAMDRVAKIRDNTGAVPPPYVIRSQWEKRRLTYCLLGGTDDLTEDELIGALEAAAWTWMEASNITLTRVVDCYGAGADIMVDFLDEDHPYYDRVFGSSDAAIAVADLPEEDYTLYLDLLDDDSIEWTTDYRVGGDSPFDVLTTLTHEFGHLLGLSHTDASCSGTLYPVMCPTYGGSNHDLASDDINGISASYGASLGYCQDGFVATHIGYSSMAESVEAMASLYASYGGYSSVSTLQLWVDYAWYYAEKAYSYGAQTAVSGPMYSAGAASHTNSATAYARIAADYAYDAYLFTGSDDATTTQYRAEDAEAAFDIAFDLMFECYRDEYGADPDF
jgi:hypothetical protein